MPVVATAGHVDHGKSRLVTALTGMEPDRLAEERRRGMTIDLGFAWCELPSGLAIGFVDVPGHERFVRTMLAGVGPVRLVMFVVAADEGWSAQSEEHLAIVDVLGVDGAVVALTKSDLVDGDGLDRAIADVRAHVSGTVLEDAPVVACSATTGAGIDRLRSELDAMIARAPATEDRGRPRLAIDRVFTIAGAGTVVTGTLGDGSLAVGDEMAVMPGDMRVRIRGLQTHGRGVERATPGSRVAVNLAGVTTDEVARGDTLIAPGTRRPTTEIQVALVPVRGRDTPSQRGAYSFHLASTDRAARLRILGEGPDGTTYARIRLAGPVVADLGDRFVLRDSGRGTTVAGGEILDVAPPRRSGAEAVGRLVRRRATRDGARAAAVVAELGAVRSEDLLALGGSTPTRDEVVDRQGWAISSQLLASARDELTEMLTAHHRDHPIEAGMPMAAVRDHMARILRRARVSSERDLIDALIAAAEDAGAISRESGFLRLPGHLAAGADDPALRGLLIRLDVSAPPTIPELLASGMPRAAIDAAIRADLIVKIAPTIVVTKRFVEDAIAAIRGSGATGLTVSEIREALGTSRKYAVPLVEHLDATRVTRREGDLRSLRDAD